MASGKIYLVSRSPLPRPPSFPLLPGSFVVGRSSACDVVIPHESVSRRHARIRIARQAITISDLNSRNGTFVNEQRIHSCSLAVGNHVKIGAIPFFVVGEDSEGLFDSDFETVDHRGDRVAIPESIIQKLSRAEISVLLLLVEGLTEKQVAAGLNVSWNTVHVHVQQIYRILKVHSRAELLSLLLKY